MTPYNGFMAPEPDEWRGPMDWLDIVFEGAWQQPTQEEIQQEINPEYEMWRNNPPV